MRKSIFWASLLMVASFGSFAQELYNNDPGYSPHNYKHPNKAKAAQSKQKALPVVASSEVVRNYKQPNMSKDRALSVERTQPKEVYLAWKNYKMPFNTNVEREKLAGTTNSDSSKNVLD